MTLEDFERELAADGAEKSNRKRSRSRTPGRTKEHQNNHRHHNRSKCTESRDEEDRDSRHGHKRSRHRSSDPLSGNKREWRNGEQSGTPVASRHNQDSGYEDGRKDVSPIPSLERVITAGPEHVSGANSKRDSWMEAPSALEVDYVQRKRRQSPPSTFVKATEENDNLQVHTDGDRDDSKKIIEIPDGRAEQEVTYTFGDTGASWRMTKLKAVYRQAEETGKSITDVAVERYGNIRAFDNAREEEVELDRRHMYGKDYVGKEKPSGELFHERMLDEGTNKVNQADNESEDEVEAAQGEVIKEIPPATTTMTLDQTALNKLKAQIMKAKMKGDPHVGQLEADYNIAIAAIANRKESDVVVLNKMESRMLAGGRKGEVKSIDNTRGRERGNVEENDNMSIEDMSIEDMVRQEKRTRGQFGGSGKAFAERIAKDVKFDDDLDYMDENANKLAKSVQKSDINLRSTAIGDFQKMKRIFDNCPLCHHEDTSTPPQAPIVSLATRVFLTLPTSPEITPYGLCASIVPVQHRLNLLECDDDEWEEIRNFMKSLSRFYHAQEPPLAVIFYENAAHEGRKRHASMEAVPLPTHLSATAPAFFRESILAADEEWAQHRKLIDTLAKSTSGGMGKQAFRKTMVAELPYFHVWFNLDGGLGHVVDDTRRWPKGDLFAREVIGGMLDVGAENIRKQGRWRKEDTEMEKRVRKFKKGWDQWDWTSVLMETR